MNCDPTCRTPEEEPFETLEEQYYNRKESMKTPMMVITLVLAVMKFNM